MRTNNDSDLAVIRSVVAERALAQGNVFRRRDLLSWGVTDATLQAMFRRGWWIRLRHGIYVDAAVHAAAGEAGRHLNHLGAAVLAGEEVTLAFGPSAALLHGHPLPYEAPSEVFIVRESGQDTRSMNRPSKHLLEIPPMRVTSRQLEGVAAEVINGIPTVGRITAAVTAAPSMSFSRKVGLMDAVLWQGAATVEELRQEAERWSQLGDHRGVLDAVDHARSGAQTFLETLSRLRLMREGIPEPLLQVPVYDDGGLVGIVDMMWPDWRVIGEADGAVKYQTRDDLIAEKRREDRLRALGFAIVRWMWEDMIKDPARVAEQIRRAVRRAA